LTVKVRNAAKSDNIRIYQIECESFKIPWDDELFQLLSRWHGKIQISKTKSLFMDILEFEDCVIGYVVWEEDYRNNKGHILNIAIDSKYRGRGYGRELLEHTFKKMKSAGIKECVLEVRLSNHAARKLYESSGMHFQSIEAEYYVDEDAAKYTRIL
jgi:ribosomal-protein-alanine N-acetyltransferase